MKQNLTYREAGVDIDAGNALVERIKPLAAATTRKGVLGSIGGFGALFELPVERYNRPVLVSGTDGVGTKLRFAIEQNQLDGLGTDLVAMCVNDIAVTGAEALFFLDYYATSSLDLDAATRVIAGIARGCELAGCALSGGETAEMPGIYQSGDFDLAGFAVGIVEKDEIIDGSTIRPGDRLIGIPSSGVHSNGFSLINRLIEQRAKHNDTVPTHISEKLLQPTRIYTQLVNSVMQSVQIKGMAHITGGGLPENLPRILPDNTCAHIDTSSWQRSEEFHWIREQGNVEAAEMYRVFNCGVGMVLIVSSEQSETTLQALRAAGQAGFELGEITRSSTEAAATASLLQLENF